MSIQPYYSDSERFSVPAKPAVPSQFTSSEEQARLEVEAAFSDGAGHIVSDQEKAALTEAPIRVDAQGELIDGARRHRIEAAEIEVAASYPKQSMPLSVEDLLQEQ